MKRIFSLFTVIVLLLIILPLHADDGMWLPHQMKMLKLQAQGLQMDPADLFREDGTGLMSAVVSLGGGTGEFVSGDGLILTNHHVAFGAIQRASSPEHDYITGGFIAPERSLEIPAYGYIADVLLGYDDVTEQVAAVLHDGMSYIEKDKALDAVVKKLIAEAEAAGSDIRATVVPMYSGNAYYRFRFKHLKDIRIVYAPPRDLGNFGGDIDNWMWPRHTCDFSFLRAYVSPGGNGDAYSENNVPYHPKSVMPISLDGLQEGDFTFVMGYPGRTYRNYTLTELKNSMLDLQTRLADFESIIDFLDERGRDNKEVEIKYASRVKGLNNALKNYQGKLEGMKKVNLIEKKKAQQDEIVAWINADPVRKETYGNVVPAIDDFLSWYRQRSSRNTLLNNLVSGYFGSTLMSQAHFIYRAAVEREKPDMERESGFQDRTWEDQKQRNLLVERGYDLATDRAYLKFRLRRLMDTPVDELPAPLRDVFAKNDPEAVDAYVDRLYEATGLADPQRRQELLAMTPKQLLALKDPMIGLAAACEKELAAMRDEDRAVNRQYQELKQAYLAAVLEMKEGGLAPDANSTIRFTYGTVEGYQPADAVHYAPFTTLKGVIEKETGAFPFRVPEKIKELHAANDFGRYEDPRLGDVVTCFLNTTNVTGGNSGSPTLNARGEQVGIIFDMTYESVIGDYYVIPALQRTISVDIRYVLFVTEKFSGADFILKEIGI
ncbi:S46 family peptidase [bacterium]|nr:S46 family peptidase [bacterium]